MCKSLQFKMQHYNTTDSAIIPKLTSTLNLVRVETIGLEQLLWVRKASCPYPPREESVQQGSNILQPSETWRAKYNLVCGKLAEMTLAWVVECYNLS